MMNDLAKLGDKKFQEFLFLLQKKVLLQEPDKKVVIYISHKNLMSIFNDEDEVGEYLRYFEKNGFIKLRHISKQRIKDKKINDETYITEITPDNDLLSSDDFYRVKRYTRINYYPEDLFIFDYDKQKIQAGIVSLQGEPKAISQTKKESSKLLISKNNLGQYFFNNKPLKFENTDTIYFKIFDVLYEKADANGFYSYGEINKFLQESGEKPLTDRTKIVERVSNGLKNLLRYSNLPKNVKTPDGRPLIKTKRGKGLIFYNPPI